jgi:hypothetical protein
MVEPNVGREFQGAIVNEKPVEAGEVPSSIAPQPHNLIKVAKRPKLKRLLQQLFAIRPAYLHGSPLLGGRPWTPPGLLVHLQFGYFRRFDKVAD